MSNKKNKQERIKNEEKKFCWKEAKKKKIINDK